MNKKYLKAFLITSVTLVVLLAILAAWLYSGNLTPAKTKIYTLFPYPMAFVNGKPLLMKNYIARLDASKNLPNPSTPKAVYDQLILEEKIKQVAHKAGVSVSKKEIEDEFKLYAPRENFKVSLNSAGVNEEDFKNHILKNQLLLLKLQIWFNSQRNLNQEAYFLADSLVSKINGGEDMGKLAAAYTQDQTGKATQGDLGFVDSALLLAEIKEQVETLKDGEVKLLTSSLGLHIIKQEGINGNLRHLRQIFLPAASFSQWLNNETQKLKVWSLVKV